MKRTYLILIIIIAVFGIGGTVFKTYFHFETRYAQAMEFKEFKQEVKTKWKFQKLEYKQKRRDTLEARHGYPAVKSNDEYQEVLREIEKLKIELKGD